MYADQNRTGNYFINRIKLFRILKNQYFQIVDGALVPAAIVEVTKKYGNGDEATIKAAEELAEVCKDVSNADTCELAIDVIKCTTWRPEFNI